MTRSTFYSVLFAILLLLQLYVPSFKLNLFIQMAALGGYFLTGRTLSVSPFFLRQVALLTAILALGFLGLICYDDHKPVNVVKDIFHFLKPLTGLLIGYFFTKEMGGPARLAKGVIYAGLVSALAHFVVVLATGGLNTGSVSDIREFGRDNFLELFAVFLLAYYKRYFGVSPFSRNLTRFFFVLLVVSCLLYLSRAMIVMAVILLLSLSHVTVITRKSLTVLGVFVLATGLLYLWLFSVKIERNKPGLEGFLFKVKMAPAEMFETRIDRENHKDLWDHWRGYEAKRALDLMDRYEGSYLIGTGHGSQVDLKFFAPLSGDEKGLRYISELHNGYVYILYKTGILGMAIYLVFLTGLYNTIHRNRSMPAVFISGIGLMYFFTTLTITGIYNARDIIIMLLGAFLCFYRSNTAKAPL